MIMLMAMAQEARKATDQSLLLLEQRCVCFVLELLNCAISVLQIALNDEFAFVITTTLTVYFLHEMK